MYTMLMTIRKTNDIPTDPDSRVNFLIYPPSSTRNGFIHSLQDLDRYKFPAVDEILMSVQRLRLNVHRGHCFPIRLVDFNPFLDPWIHEKFPLWRGMLSHKRKE